MNRRGEYVLHYRHYVWHFREKTAKCGTGGERESQTTGKAARDIWLKGDPFFALAP